MQTQTPVEARISNLNARIDNLYKCHDMADGQAYSDFCEKEEIDKLIVELRYWRRMKRLDEMDKISSRFDDDFKKVFA